MILNLMGVPTNLPLYDQDGNIVNGVQQEDDIQFAFCKRLVETVADILSKLDTSKSDLTVSEEVNVYDMDIELVDAQDDVQEYYSVSIFGGLNGRGIWSDYLADLESLVRGLEEKFNDVWVMKFDIDSLDDVFDVEIGIIP